MGREYWDAQNVDSDEQNDEILVKDSNGTALKEGDSVHVIKDLKVKGSSLIVKRGTMVRNIHLTDNPEEIEGKAEKTTIVLKTCFLKKNQD